MELDGHNELRVVTTNIWMNHLVLYNIASQGCVGLFFVRFYFQSRTRGSD